MRIIWFGLTLTAIFFLYSCESDEFDPFGNSGFGNSDAIEFNRDVILNESGLSVDFKNNSGHVIDSPVLFIIDNMGNLIADKALQGSSSSLSSKSVGRFYWYYVKEDHLDKSHGPDWIARVEGDDGTIYASKYFHVGVPMDIEYDWMADYDALELSRYGGGITSVQRVFGSALMDVYFAEDQNNLPAWTYNTYPFSTEDGRKEYATVNYNSENGYYWHLLSVDNYWQNTIDEFSAAGISNNEILENPNNPIQTVEERYSYIFVEDIQEWYSDEPKKVNWCLWFISTHELAHQRFGLLDEQPHFDYHYNYEDGGPFALRGLGEQDVDGNYDAYCVMDYATTGHWNTSSSIFCNSSNAYPQDFTITEGTNNCWDNIYPNLNME